MASAKIPTETRVRILSELCAAVRPSWTAQAIVNDPNYPGPPTELVAGVNVSGHTSAMIGVDVYPEITVQVSATSNETFTVTINGQAISIASGGGATFDSIVNALVIAIRAQLHTAQVIPGNASGGVLALVGAKPIPFSVEASATGAATAVVTADPCDVVFQLWGIPTGRDIPVWCTIPGALVEIESLGSYVERVSCAGIDTLFVEIVSADRQVQPWLAPCILEDETGNPLAITE